MEFFVKNAQAVMASEGFEKVAESPETMREMMSAMALGSKKQPASSDADYKRMSVATLRQKLDDKGLDVDGSKEMLVARLEDGDAEAQAEAGTEAESEDEDE